MSDQRDDLTDEQIVAAVREKEERRRKREIEDLIKLMDTAHGRRFVWKLLGQCGVFRLSYSGELASTSFNEGQRNIGLGLFAEIMKHCPNLYLLMADEAKEIE
jgi:hypothetical protein